MIRKLLFIALLIALGLYANNYLQQRAVVESPEPVTNEEVAAEENASEVESSVVAEETATPAAQVAEDVSEEGIQVDESLISDEQKELLEQFGIDTSAITVTAEMIACAEDKVGAERIEEIKNGALPTFFEGLSLATCY